MRLTLRTLIAWLDDTLPVTSAQEIGKQVAETANAQELSDRINRVIRQRRLMVPEDGGPEGIDPNLTAAYLEDQLSSDEVIEFEKRCLTSDVCLAETVSVHQVISLLGQRAKVPPAARHRMYRLLKGDHKRSGTSSEPTLDLTGPSSPKAEPLPEPEPMSSAVVARRWMAAMGLVAMIGVMSWLALRPVPQQPHPDLLASNTNPAQPKIAPLGEGLKIEAPNGAKADPEKSVEPNADTKTADADATGKTVAEGEMKNDEANPDPNANPQVNFSEIKIIDRQGVIFRYNRERQAWEPAPPADGRLATGERFAIVEPSRLELQVGGAGGVLLAPALWEVLPPGSNALRVKLAQGRLILNTPVPPKSYEIVVDSAKLTFALPPGGRLGIELTRLSQPGGARSPLEVWIICSEPATRLTGVGGKEFVLEAGTHRLGLADESLTLLDKKFPAWFENDQLNGLEKEVAREFSRFFEVQTTVIKALYSAVEDPKEQIRRVGVKALGTLGQTDLVMDLLAKENSPYVRQVAMETLRNILDQGGEAAEKLNKEIADRYQYDPTVAKTIQKLLQGYSPQEVQADPKILSQLVDQLESSELPIREMTISVLSSLTGRDRLGYDADNPAQGAAVWKQLLKRGELQVVGAPALIAAP